MEGRLHPPEPQALLLLTLGGLRLHQEALVSFPKAAEHEAGGACTRLLCRRGACGRGGSPRLAQAPPYRGQHQDQESEEARAERAGRLGCHALFYLSMRRPPTTTLFPCTTL